MTISARISDLLRQKGITQKALAETIGVTPSTVNTWIKTDAESIPSAYIMSVCRLFEICPEELLDGTPGANTNATIPDGYEQLDESESRLISILRSLDWEGKNIVINAAIMEHRTNLASGKNPAGTREIDVG